MRNSLPRAAIAVVGAAAAIISSVFAVPSAGAATPVFTQQWSYSLRTGVTIALYKSSSPLIRLWVITDTLGSSGNATIDNVSAGSTITSIAATSTTASKAGAVAAINADFGAFVKRTEHAYLQNGELWQTGVDATNNVFAVTAASPYSTHTPTVTMGKPSLHVDVLTPTTTLSVAELNSGKPTGDEIVAFTPKGLSAEKAGSTGYCNVHLKQASPPDYQWGSSNNGVRVSYTVDKAMVCDTSLSAGTGGLVLSVRKASTVAKPEIKALTVGTKVGLRWQYGMPGILDSVGGRPMIVENGAPAGTGTGGMFVCDLSNPDNLCKAQPRSAVATTQACTTGASSGCKVFMVVVDGRQTNWSSGISLDNFAYFLTHTLNAYSALNFDGGGSATMWTSTKGNWCSSVVPVSGTGCLVNKPWKTSTQTTNERPIVNDLIIRPGADPGDPSPK